MKVLIYGLNYFPELTGVGKYTGEMAAWLAQRGHQVRAVVAPPYYPEWRVGSGYSGWRYATEDIAGVRVVRCPLWVPRKVTSLKRLVHLLSFAASSFLAVVRQMFWRPDLVVVIEPTFFCAPGGWLAGKLAGALTMLHIQDFELDAALGLGLMSTSRLVRVVQAMERFMLRRFDLVSTISQAMVSKLQQKGVAPGHTLMFPNWADTKGVFHSSGPSPFRKQLGIPDGAIVALYAGNLGEKQGLDIMVEAAKRLAASPDLVFVIAGEGAARERLYQMAKGLDNIRWLPLQPLSLLNDLLNLADIHLLLQRAGAADLVMPSKLTGMLASGRPVVATAVEGTEVAHVVQLAGTLVPPGDVDSLVRALTRLAGAPDERRRLGEAGRRYAVERLSTDVVLGRLEADLLGRINARAS